MPARRILPTLRRVAVRASQSLRCLEVCGGHEASRGHFRRPGLDVVLCSEVQQETDAGGGELHLISSCASGRITRIMLADVCGHGPLFDELAGGLAALMKRNVNSVRQTRAVQQMNRQLQDASTKGGLASTMLTTYFAPTRSFTICNAGHPPPFLFRSSRNEWSVLKGQPGDSAEQASAFLEAAEYQQFYTKLEVGDFVLGYSNALTECRDSDGRTLGVEGLLERVRRLDVSVPGTLPRVLLDRIRMEQPGNLTGQDATIVLCQATDTAVAWRDNLLAPLRLLRSVRDRTSLARLE